MNRKILALLTLAVALGLAAVALGDYPMPVGLYVPGIQQWQSAPSTPTTVSASQGYVPMTGAAVTFTTPPKYPTTKCARAVSAAGHVAETLPKKGSRQCLR